MEDPKTTPEFKSTYLFFSEFKEGVSKEFYTWFIDVMEHHKKHKLNSVTIYINSPGGYLDELFAIIDAIDMMKSAGIEVKTFATGMVASCAFLLFIQGTEGCRIATKNTQLLSHQFSGGNYGNYSVLKNQREHEDWLHNRMIKIYKKCLPHLSDKQINKLLLKETDTFLYADKALTLGIVNQII